ncbi:MAG: hypothetical protein WCK51_06960 [Armatimonadota bacterium]
MVFLVGCQGGEETKPEAPASQEAAKTAAGNWTPEQQKIFAEENKKARTGQDSGTGGAPTGVGK